MNALHQSIHSAFANSRAELDEIGGINHLTLKHCRLVLWRGKTQIDERCCGLQQSGGFWMLHARHWKTLLRL